MWVCMEFIRDFIDRYYRGHRDRIFRKTEDDPEVAHEQFVKLACRIHSFRLERLLLNCSENQLKPRFEISNAAGFNKNGTIPPQFLHYLGLDRVVVGTVTYDAYPGEPRPRIKRYPNTNSMLNWMKLPGIGARAVADAINEHGNHGVPVTINLMATPGKKGDEMLSDLDETIKATRDLPHVDRYELNISCPNTHTSGNATDARNGYQQNLSAMLNVVEQAIKINQDIYVKVSPDMLFEDVKTIIHVSCAYSVAGFTTANSTTEHKPLYITSPPNQEGKGGATGAAVYSKSRLIQERFDKELDSYRDYNAHLIACGGIDSPDKARARTDSNRVIGIQVFTPLIMKGPGLIRELRAA